jgi:hypothetical protein
MEKIILKRIDPEIPFGFKLQGKFDYNLFHSIFKTKKKIKGGSDFKIPLSILQITANSIAEKAGLKIGDEIIKINDLDTKRMEHNRAKMELMRCGIKKFFERKFIDLFI